MCHIRNVNLWLDLHVTHVPGYVTLVPCRQRHCLVYMYSSTQGSMMQQPTPCTATQRKLQVQSTSTIILLSIKSRVSVFYVDLISSRKSHPNSSIGIVYTLINGRPDQSTNVSRYKRVLSLIIPINYHTRRIARHDRGPLRKQSKTETLKHNREWLVPGQIWDQFSDPQYSLV